MQLPLFNQAGQEIGKTELRDDIFAVEPNVSVMHQALVRQLANARQGTSDTKTRGEIRGGGRKPWRQKGTGRARQGSTRAPHWRHGGVVFGPQPRSYTKAFPRAMRHGALRSALSAKVADGEVLGLDGFQIADERPNTKQVASLLNAL